MTRLALLLALLAGPALAQPAPAPAPSPPAQQPLGPPVPPVEWVPQGSVELRALDKVTARTATLAGKVGDTLRFGTLSITVRQCLTRPPDRAADAAAWVDITDSRPDAPGFHGWMVLSAPALGVLEHPLYDVRLAACRP